MKVTPCTKQSDLKRKDGKVDRAIQSHDKKIKKLQKAVTSEKVKPVVKNLTLVAKVNIEKKTAKVVEVVNTLNVKHCNERNVYEVHIKEKEHELDGAMKYDDLESTKALGNHLVIKEVNILAGSQGNETFQIERMLWVEKITQYKKHI